MKSNLLKSFGVVFICLFVFPSFLMIFWIEINVYDQKDNLIEDFNNYETLKTAADIPNGKPLKAKQIANISKSYEEEELPTNISFNLAPGWTSKNVTINYKGLAQKKDWIINGTFDSVEDMNDWTYHESGTYWFNEGYFGNRGNPQGSAGFSATEMGGGDIAYFEQNISISDEFSSREATLSADVYMAYSGGRFNGCLFISLIIDGKEINNTAHAETIQTGEWVPLSIIYNPITYGHVLPNTASVRVGVYGYEDDSIISWQDFCFDNVKYEPWTKPNISNIVIATDNEFNYNYSYINTSYGEGYSFIDVERYREVSDEITFTIHQNITDISDLSIDTITINSCAEKSFNTTILGISGSEYELGSNIGWYTELSISSIPPHYTCWVEIGKPSDWSFTQIIDGYEADRTENCLGVTFGSTKLTIPTNILSPGLWKFEAISMNYMNNGSIKFWNITSFEPSTLLTFGDIFQISITLNNTIALLNTQINCSILYPNGSVFWHDSKEPASYNISYGNFTVGSNMTVGKYTVKTKWTNNQNSSLIDKVGYKEFDFVVWHHSSLTAVTPSFEIVTGDPLLVKAKFTDIDTNSSITFATVKYNSTFGHSGTMFYQGSGIYLADIDTNSLGLGIYYISVNATTDYYENQSVSNLIQVNVIAQSLVLDVPHKVIEATANNYAICQVNVTGAISGAMIPNATLSTNWQKYYNYLDHNNGTYTLNFSTNNLPTQGIIETFSISVYANKTDYGETSSFITLTVYPIETIVNANASIINARVNNIYDIHLNFTNEESGLLIEGANYSVVWPSLFNIILDDQGIIVQLNTINLSIDTYTAIIKVEKLGFETSFKTITVVIDYIDFMIKPINFQDSLQITAGETNIIIIKLTDPYTDVPIDNASVFYSWEFGLGYFDYISNGTYELELKIPKEIKGNHKMTLIVSKQGSIYKTTEFSFIISAENPSQSNSLPWFVLAILITVISILGIISLRSYLIIPLKKKRESDLLAKTQRYKDTMNIETILISDRNSGLHLYSKSYSVLKNYQNELLTGFIQAITLISNEIVGKENIEKISIKSDKYKDFEKIIELDFKHFNFFISDYRDYRIIFILKDKASERFKIKAAEFLSSIDQLASDKLKKWDGSVEVYNNMLPPLLEKHFHLSYREKFKINPVINISEVVKEGEFNKPGRRLINVIVSMTRVQEEFYLEDVLTTMHGKSKDKLIKALEKIITEQIIISSIDNNVQ